MVTERYSDKRQDHSGKTRPEDIQDVRYNDGRPDRFAHCTGQPFTVHDRISERDTDDISFLYLFIYFHHHEYIICVCI